jgi:hypothetical protein
MRQHSKNQKGQDQKDTKHMNPPLKNEMQRKQTSSGGSKKELENAMVRSFSSSLIVVK